MTKVFTPKAINECPDCQFTSASYNDFLEHRVKCLREKHVMKELYLGQAREQLSRLKSKGFMNLQHVIADYHKDLISFGYTAEFTSEVTDILTNEYCK